MGIDLILVLIVVLILVLMWRGPKTLPQIGAMFGRGVKATRDEAADLTKDLGKDKTTPS